MTPEERLRVRRAERRTALRRLGALNVECPWCGETDPLCFDVEHPERRAVSKFVWALCKNCHAKKSSRERSEHPSIQRFVTDPKEKAAHALLGHALYLEAITDRLREIADLLFQDRGPGPDA